jgi:hypothetical protein
MVYQPDNELFRQDNLNTHRIWKESKRSHRQTKR